MSSLRSPQRLLFVRAALLCALSLLLALPLLAQDASQVLQLSVAYRTLKNRVPMDEAKRKLIEELETKARTANNDKKYGEAVKHLSHGLALMRNQPWTPLHALNTALQVKTDRRVFDPGDPVRLKLSQIFTLDDPVPGKVALALALTQMRDGARTTVKELKTMPDVTADFSKELTLDAVLPQTDAGNYQLLLTLTPKEGDAVNKPLSVRIERNLNAEAELLKKRILAVRSDLEQQRAAASQTTRNDPTSLLNALPRADYAASLIEMINLGALPLERFNLRGEFIQANQLLDQIVKGEHPLRAKRGDVHWAYASAVDNTPQPYRLFIPSQYDAKRKWPLVVALHGMGGDENSFFAGYSNGVIKQEAEKRGYLIVCPKGRAPASMYLGSAERDVLDVLKEVKREFSIDEDRVYLMGHSMGGYGTWSVSVNNPDLFAALGPISGGGQPLVTARLKNIAHVPWIVVHGDKDPTVSVEESRKMVKAGEALGIKIKYIEVPGGDHSNIVVPAFKDIFDWFDANKRQPATAKASAKVAGGNQ